MPTSARSVWKGYLQFSLVTVPVRAYTASAPGGGTISLNQLHDKCHSRIRYKKTCPIHGEVPNDQIVTGYEFDKDQYVVVEPAEIEKLRTRREKAITVEAFVPHDSRPGAAAAGGVRRGRRCRQGQRRRVEAGQEPDRHTSAEKRSNIS